MKGKADDAALRLAEIGELGHAANVYAGTGTELHGLDHLPRLPETAVGKDFDVEGRRFRVDVIGEHPGKHLVFGADVVAAPA